MSTPDWIWPQPPPPDSVNGPAPSWMPDWVAKVYLASAPISSLTVPPELAAPVTEPPDPESSPRGEVCPVCEDDLNGSEYWCGEECQAVWQAAGANPLADAYTWQPHIVQVSFRSSSGPSQGEPPCPTLRS